MTSNRLFLLVVPNCSNPLHNISDRDVHYADLPRLMSISAEPKVLHNPRVITASAFTFLITVGSTSRDLQAKRETTACRTVEYAPEVFEGKRNGKAYVMDSLY